MTSRICLWKVRARQRKRIRVTDDEKYIDRMFTAYGEKICCVVVGTSAKDMNESGMVVANIHKVVTQVVV